ncbi:MAG: hypothetical protein WCO85_09395 [Actinomycetes bacterium]
MKLRKRATALAVLLFFASSFLTPISAAHADGTIPVGNVSCSLTDNGVQYSVSMTFSSGDVSIGNLTYDWDYSLLNPGSSPSLVSNFKPRQFFKNTMGNGLNMAYGELLNLASGDTNATILVLVSPINTKGSSVVRNANGRGCYVELPKVLSYVTSVAEKVVAEKVAAEKVAAEKVAAEKAAAEKAAAEKAAAEKAVGDFEISNARFWVCGSWYFYLLDNDLSDALNIKKGLGVKQEFESNLRVLTTGFSTTLAGLAKPSKTDAIIFTKVSKTVYVSRLKTEKEYFMKARVGLVEKNKLDIDGVIQHLKSLKTFAQPVCVVK